jgi:hypothetical protein
MGENKSLLGTVLTWVLIGVVAIIAIKVALGVLGVVFGLASFVLFTVAPILLLGWLALKAWQAFARPADS